MNNYNPESPTEVKQGKPEAYGHRIATLREAKHIITIISQTFENHRPGNVVEPQLPKLQLVKAEELTENREFDAIRAAEAEVLKAIDEAA